MGMRAILGRAQRMASVLNYLAAHPGAVKSHITGAVAPGQNVPVTDALDSLLARGWIKAEPHPKAWGAVWKITERAPAGKVFDACYAALLEG